METINLLGALLGIAFVSGFRLYATILAIGLGINLGLIHLDPAMKNLAVLGDPLILTIAGFLYLLEFFVDKVPWLDSLWDAIHTVIRPLGAALLAATALGSVDPVLRFAGVLLCGAVALSGHTAKAGTRLLINHSPEPFSNIFMSLGEDVFSLFALWLSLVHPVVMLGLVVLFLVLLAWLIPKFFRLAKRSAQRIAAWARQRSGTTTLPPTGMPQSGTPM